MGKRIVIIQGHPDPAGGHFDHALVAAYADAARDAGHQVEIIQVAELDFPILRSFSDWTEGEPTAAIKRCQELLKQAEHWVIVYPLWLGDMPALLKAFLEQVARPGFAFEYLEGGRWKRLLKGHSARIVVTMGMPALFYRAFFRAHSLKSLKRNILGFVGVAPVHDTVLGGVEMSAERRQRFLRDMEKLGRRGH